MAAHVRIKLLYLPLLGIILGIFYAFLFTSGLIAIWQFIGKPADGISQIIGVVGGDQLFVRTVSGDIYSLDYRMYINEKNYRLPSALFSSFPPVSWNKEEKRTIQPDPTKEPIMNFASWPLLFRVEQQYEVLYQLVEGQQLTKFALSEDGDLWIWNYGKGGMANLTYFIFPAIGFFYGSILAVLINFGIFLWGIFMPKPI